MDIHTTPISGLLLIEPRRFSDDRGFFVETYHRERYEKAGIETLLPQDNHSRSTRGVLRGLHFQVKRPQAQIVTVIRGRIFDVAVDLRPSSPTFRRWFGAELSDEGICQIAMAPGFAHGFCELSDVADLHYQVGSLYDPHDEGGLIWNDPSIGIKWPTIPTSISPRDAAYPAFAELLPEQLPRIASESP